MLTAFLHTSPLPRGKFTRDLMNYARSANIPLNRSRIRGAHEHFCLLLQARVIDAFETYEWEMSSQTQAHRKQKDVYRLKRISVLRAELLKPYRQCSLARVLRGWIRGCTDTRVHTVAIYIRGLRRCIGNADSVGPASGYILGHVTPRVRGEGGEKDPDMPFPVE